MFIVTIFSLSLPKQKHSDMVFLITGQIYSISDVHTFGKNERLKQTIVITCRNSIDNRLEHLVFDAFTEDMFQHIEEKNLAVGNSISISFMHIGRKSANKNKEICFYENKQILNIKLL